MLKINPTLIDCYGLPITTREWILELDNLDCEVMLPKPWQGHAEIIRKFEKKKSLEQRELFNILNSD